MMPWINYRPVMAKTWQMVQARDVMLQGFFPKEWLSLAGGLVRRFWNKSVN